MKCPACGFAESKVVDSRPVNDGSSIRRRRECLQCQKRFTTFEIMESVQIFVIKKNGEKQLFDKSKLLVGVLKATQKRPVNAEEIVNQIEQELQNTLRHEIPSQELGEMGKIVANITLFAVLVYEIVGPLLTKISLLKAGDIRPEGKTSARLKDSESAE